MGRLSAPAIVERTRRKVNERYDMSIRDVRELERGYGAGYDLIFATFVFGYAQGIKAEKARVANCSR